MANTGKNREQGSAFESAKSIAESLTSAFKGPTFQVDSSAQQPAQEGSQDAGEAPYEQYYDGGNQSFNPPPPPKPPEAVHRISNVTREDDDAKMPTAPKPPVTTQHVELANAANEAARNLKADKGNAPAANQVSPSRTLVNESSAASSSATENINGLSADTGESSGGAVRSEPESGQKPKSTTRKWKRSNIAEDARKSANNNGQQEPAVSTSTTAKADPVSQDEASAPSPVNLRKTIDDFFRTRLYSRSREARNRNKATYRQMRKDNPSLTWDEFIKSDKADQESFSNTPKPIGSNSYRTNEKYEQGKLLRDEGQYSDIDDSMKDKGVGFTVKDLRKLWRLLDQTVWDMKVGFFHVESEKLTVDEKTGEEKLTWNSRVENAMNRVMEDFGGSGIDGQRTVFRLVRLYATMAIDRQGKMFNMGKDEWSLTIDEFVDICNCIHSSILLYGHPFVMPAFLTSSRGKRTKLRRTDMFPSGVVPRVVAQAITGPDSKVRFVVGPKKGQPMTADELINAAHKEWVNRTQPVMNATLVESNKYEKKKKKQKKEKIEDGVYIVREEEVKERNLVAQKIAVENAMQAFARLDGTSAEAFGAKFNIDTAQHYKLWEYESQLIEYASAANNKYDAEAVKERQIAKIRKNSEKRSNRKELTAFEVACNIMSSGIKTNALWWNLPIKVSADAERGVGNFQTKLTLAGLRRMYRNPEKFRVPKEVADSLRTQEGFEAIDAAFMLLEIGGPVELLEFASTGSPMTLNNVVKHLRDNVMKKPGSKRAADLQELNVKLNKYSQKVLSGSGAFKKSTVQNFLDALMISNQAIAGVQGKLAETGKIDDYAGLSLTGNEMLDIFLAHNGDISSFITEIAGTSAGRDALMMMNANNIAQFNVVSYSVNAKLRDHGIGNAAITAFLDSFASYGINFLYAMIPGSKTFTYLSLKKMEDDGDITAADFAIGGGLGTGENHSPFRFKDEPGFYDGLKMNIWFDCVTLGKWGLCGILIGGVLAALGFDLPDKPEDRANVSMWKIGKNVGWGPDTNGDGSADGIEISYAYWLNDLTQWGLPNAFFIAALLSGHDMGDATNLFKDSLADQFDGNVVLDFIDLIKNWGDDVVDIDAAMKDPSHEMERSPMFAVSEVALNAFGKMVPGAPLYKAWGKSAALRGPNARMYSTNTAFDKESEWAKEVGKADYIDDPVERLLRKYSAGNWLLAGALNVADVITGKADKATGHFWWEMPIRDYTEPFALVLSEMQKMDYDHLEEGETYESYRAKRTDELIEYIKNHYSDPEEAIRDGFFIRGDLREAALHTCFSELNALENEWDTKCDLQFEYKSEFMEAQEEYKNRKQELWDFINNWLRNDDIPTWTANYEQLLSDWEKSYVKNDGTPVTAMDKFLDDTLFHKGDIETKWKLKGNHPTSMSPITFVDYSSNDMVQRGFSGETKPLWESDSSTLATLNALGDEVIKIGRNAGLTVNDVYRGPEVDGERLHPDDITIGTRAMIPKESKLPESLRNINQDNCDGGIYGDLGKRKQESAESSDSENKKPWVQEYGPDDKLPYKVNDVNPYTPSFYPKRSYGIGTKSNTGGNYNPKIYSNPRQVNADRAATMYTKTPQTARTTYLRPGFSTKGSREAYKRQDI